MFTSNIFPSFTDLKTTILKNYVWIWIDIWQWFGQVDNQWFEILKAILFQWNVKWQRNIEWTTIWLLNFESLHMMFVIHHISSVYFETTKIHLFQVKKHGYKLKLSKTKMTTVILWFWLHDEDFVNKKGKVQSN